MPDTRQSQAFQCGFPKSIRIADVRNTSAEDSFLDESSPRPMGPAGAGSEHKSPDERGMQVKKIISYVCNLFTRLNCSRSWTVQETPIGLADLGNRAFLEEWRKIVLHRVCGTALRHQRRTADSAGDRQRPG